MCAHRVFLTGDPGYGKTTAIRMISEILAGKGIRAGGMISGEIRESGIRMGFRLEDLMTHEHGVLAHVNQKDGPRVGRYRVNLPDIQRVGVAAIRRAIEDAFVIIVDELGPMELHSMPFILAVEMALASPRHFVGTIHKRASHFLVTAIKSNPAYEIIEVTPQNREEMPTKIAERLSGHA